MSHTTTPRAVLLEEKAREWSDQLAEWALTRGILAHGERITVHIHVSQEPLVEVHCTEAVTVMPVIKYFSVARLLTRGVSKQRSIYVERFFFTLLAGREYMRMEEFLEYYSKRTLLHMPKMGTRLMYIITYVMAQDGLALREE